MLPDPAEKSWIESAGSAVKSLFTGSQHHKLQKAISAMLPLWDELSATNNKLYLAETFLQQIDQVWFCFENLFLNESGWCDSIELKEVC
jgi:hypothetical protein